MPYDRDQHRAGVARAIARYQHRHRGELPLTDLPPKRPQRHDERNLRQAILARYDNDPRIYLKPSPSMMVRSLTSDTRYSVGVPGQADLDGCLAPSGRAIYVETKTETGRQSQAQRRFQESVERRGALYVIARSVEDVEGVLG